jgi:hypothetical protein
MVSGGACSVVGQGVVSGGWLYPMVLRHNVSQYSAQGQ